MRGFLLSGSACAILIVFACAGPSLSLADELTFFPSIVQAESTLGINAYFMSSTYSQGARQFSSTQTFLAERLNLAADGYVYHPRFEVFTIRMSGGLDQGHVRGTENVRANDSALDYELRTTFLPMHPYNLELFALHHEASPLSTFGRGQRSNVDDRGAIFSFKSNPYFLNLSYNVSSVDSGANRSDTTSYRASGSHSGRVMNQSASYLHADSSSVFALTERDEYSYTNAIRYADAVLNSRINGRTLDQTNLTYPGLHTEGFIWNELLLAKLPANFSADVSFSYQDEKNRIEGGGTGPAVAEEFNRSIGTSFHLSHHLYQSLVTNFPEHRTTTTSRAGEITSRADMLTFNYMKKIPTGLLTLDALYGNATSERVGSTNIINEVHNAALGGNFTLSQQNVTAGSIVIEIRDPATGILMTLPSTNYIIQYLGGAVQITITGVSPATPQIDPAYLYEFRANYTLSYQSRIDTIFTGYSVKADIIRDRLNAYYNVNRSEQELVTGSIPGGPDVSVRQAIGMNGHKGPYSGNIEYSSYRSRVTPLESLIMFAQYRDAVGRDVNANARLTTSWTEHFPTNVSFGYHDRMYGADAGMDMRFSGTNITAYMSASYFKFQSLIDTNRMSFNAYATWQLGLLSVNGGVQLNRTETLYATGTTSLESQYYYVMLSRKLF